MELSNFFISENGELSFKTSNTVEVVEGFFTNIYGGGIIIKKP